MATLGDLKARITQETLRDDLADDLKGALDNAIQKAISTYESERWWFNEALRNVACVVGSITVPFPADAQRIDIIRAVIGGVRYRMTMRTVDYIEALYSTPQSGQPTDWAALGPNIRLWPTPNQAYPLLMELVTQVSPPLDYTLDTSTNVWTNDGADLIVGEVKLRLYRDYLSVSAQDPRINNATMQRDDAYTTLKADTNRRIGTGKVAPGW